MNKFFFDFRQMNSEADSGNEEANSLDQKRLKVNAQVTAINTGLEMIGSITFVIVLKWMKGTTLGVFIYFQIFHSILMPFAFLSNTSENKSRIVEIGWRNVMKNIVDNVQNHIVYFCGTNTDKVDVTSDYPKEDAPKNNNKDGTSVMKLETRDDQSVSSNNELFTTRVVQNVIALETVAELNVPTNAKKHCTSKAESFSDDIKHPSEQLDKNECIELDVSSL